MRLRVSEHRRWLARSSISIPSGAIKSTSICDPKRFAQRISIPSGAIKRQSILDFDFDLIGISIPSGAIKSLDHALAVYKLLKPFQFLLVRLRGYGR